MTSNHNKNNEATTVDLMKFVLICLKKWWCFAIVMFCMGTIMYCSSRISWIPTYSSSVKVLVNNSGESSKPSYSDLEASARLVKIYNEILISNDTVAVIKEAADVDYSIPQIKGMMKFVSFEDVQVFYLTITSEDAKDSYDIARAFAEQIPQTFVDIKLFGQAGAVVIESPELPMVPDSVNHLFKGVLGAMIGFMVVAVILLVGMISDNTISGESDIEDVTDIPILVHIPDLVSRAKKDVGRGYGYGSYYKKSNYEGK